MPPCDRLVYSRYTKCCSILFTEFHKRNCNKIVRNKCGNRLQDMKWMRNYYQKKNGTTIHSLVFFFFIGLCKLIFQFILFCWCMDKNVACLSFASMQNISQFFPIQFKLRVFMRVYVALSIFFFLHFSWYKYMICV